MKKTRKLLVLVLMVALCIGMIPMTAFADPGSGIYVNDVEMEVNKYLPNGSTTLQNNAPATGGYAFLKNANTLELNNYVIDGDGINKAIDVGEVGSFTIELVGKNYLKGVARGISSKSNVKILEKKANSTLTLEAKTGIYAAADILIEGGTITVNASTDGLFTDAGAIVINGGKVKTTGGEEGSGITAGTDVVINDGVVEASGGMWGIDAYIGDISIKGGTITATGGDDGICAENGNVNISGGDIKATGLEGDGIDAYKEGSQVTIDCHSIIITGEHYGIYAQPNAINIESGSVTIICTSEEVNEPYYSCNSRPSLANYDGEYTVFAGEVKPGTELELPLAEDYYKVKYLRIAPPVEEAPPEDPAPPADSEDPAAPVDENVADQGDKAPATGDANMLVLWIGLALASVAGTTYVLRRKQYNK